MSEKAVTVEVNPDPIIIQILDKTSPTIEINDHPTEVSVNGSDVPIVNVHLGGGRGPIWLPGQAYDPTRLAAILNNAISKQQLAEDLSSWIDATQTGLDAARNDLAAAIQTGAVTGQLIDEVVSRINQADELITLQVSRLNAVEANISTAQITLEDAVLRLTAAEGTLDSTTDYMVAQESLLKNEWNLKIQENADGTAAVAGVGLLMYPAWKALRLYEENEYVWSNDNAYRAKVAHTSLEENAPPHMTYWELVPYATKSQFGVLADSFFIQTNTGEKSIPFVVYGDQVLINGDMMVNGLIQAGIVSANKMFTWSIESQNYVKGISGYKLDAITGQAEFNDFLMTINYSDITDAPTALIDIDAAAAEKLGSIAEGADNTQTAIDGIVDTHEGGLIVRNNATNQYAHFTGGDLTFFDFYDNAWHPYKSVTKIVTGTCSNGQEIDIGYFRTPPVVILSPFRLDCYHAGYLNQNQRFALNATNLRQSNNKWFFTAEASLTLAAGSIALGGTGMAYVGFGTLICDKLNQQVRGGPRSSDRKPGFVSLFFVSSGCL